jgi:penicillin-binding protein 1A
MRGLLRSSAAFGVVSVVTPLLCAFVVLATLIYVPLPATLPEALPGLESRISRMLDTAGNEIAVFREFETAIPVGPEDIPQVLRDAVVAAEDRSFYEHGGIDVRGTIRALFADVQSGEAVQGGSTITQQYVRNAFEEVGRERTVSRKIREAIFASQLDRQEDKDEILFRYLSVIYLGEGAYGVGAAVETYFRKPVAELTLSEAALLAGVIPAPSDFSPRVDPALAEQRRVLVLDAMEEEDLISPAQHALALTERVWLAENGPPPGPATVVQPPVQQASTRPWFTDFTRRWLEANLPGCVPGDCQALYRGGLTITTPLDPRIQDAADAEMFRRVEGTEPDLQMSIVSVEPPTGFVRAMVGGRDFAASQVNTALGAAGGGADRDVGSSFKPFVLAAAFERGIQPEATYSGSPHDVSVPCGGDQVIGNYGGSSFGTLDLRAGTARSVNTVFTRLILDVGVIETMEVANRLGLSIEPLPGDCAAVALGVKGASPLEMASAFGVFANHGLRVPPVPVLQVIDADGEIIIDNTDPAARGEQVIAPEVADNITSILRGVIDGGTASGRDIGRPAAGKTGTTNDNKNAWFVGYTPSLSTAVWMGYTLERPLLNVGGFARVDGGTVPARAWQSFMQVALEGVPVTEFTEPAPIANVRDEVLRRARGGFGPGFPQVPIPPPPVDGFVEADVAPDVDVPATTVTTTPTTTVDTTPSTDVTAPPTTPFTLFPQG